VEAMVKEAKTAPDILPGQDVRALLKPGVIPATK
jgi:hypothetical protein